jgi:hypothetical protein
MTEYEILSALAFCAAAFLLGIILFVSRMMPTSAPKPITLFDPDAEETAHLDLGSAEMRWQEPEKNPASFESARIRRGVMVSLKYLRGVAVLNAPRDQPIQELATHLAVEVTGHLNLIHLVTQILQATDTMAEPKPDAATPWPGVETSSDEREMTVLPVKTLGSVAAEAQVKAAFQTSEIGYPLAVETTGDFVTPKELCDDPRLFAIAVLRRYQMGIGPLTPADAKRIADTISTGDQK